VSKLIKKLPPFVEIVCSMYNSVVIPLQKLQVFFYLNRYDIKKWINEFNRINDFCVIYSSKERDFYTKKSLAKLLAKKNKFDILWIDGSETLSAIKLLKSISEADCRFVAVFNKIFGGPDIAIMLGLKLGLCKGYKYVMLLENDVLLDSNWYEKVEEIFSRKPVGGMEIGACGLINYKNRNLRSYRGYSIAYAVGASAVVFKREAVISVLKNYGLTTSLRINNVFSDKFGNISLSNYSLFHGSSNHLQGADWNFCPTLFKNRNICVCPVPTLAKNMDDPPEKFKTEYM
jgi:hypothetical protein